jgi:hypothetical protein
VLTVGFATFDALLRGREGHEAQELLLFTDRDPAATAIPARFFYFARTAMTATSGGTLFVPLSRSQDRVAALVRGHQNYVFECLFFCASLCAEGLASLTGCVPW